MAKPKSNEKSAQISFKCSPALLESMKTLAHIQMRSMSDILVSLCIGYIDANRDAILDDRQKTARAISRIKSPIYGGSPIDDNA